MDEEDNLDDDEDEGGEDNLGDEDEDGEEEEEEEKDQEQPDGGCEDNLMKMIIIIITFYSPRSKVSCEHEVCSIELKTVLSGTAPIHHILDLNIYFRYFEYLLTQHSSIISWIYNYVELHKYF